MFSCPLFGRQFSVLPKAPFAHALPSCKSGHKSTWPHNSLMSVQLAFVHVHLARARQTLTDTPCMSCQNIPRHLREGLGMPVLTLTFILQSLALVCFASLTADWLNLMGSMIIPECLMTAGLVMSLQTLTLQHWVKPTHMICWRSMIACSKMSHCIDVTSHMTRLTCELLWCCTRVP